MKDDECCLLTVLRKRTKFGHVYVRDLVTELGMNEKRAAYILEKWYDKGWYECGVSIMAGWLTEEGMK